jgi:5'-3' exonuclease
MGIKDYVKFVKTNYTKACKDRWLNRYSNLYIDLNHVLHQVCYQSHSDEDVLKRVKTYLNSVIMQYRPTKKLYIGADGAAPIAKMMLQRKRRYASVKLLEMGEELNMSKNLSLNFTPGTEFMQNLSKELQYFKSYIEITYGVEVVLDIESVDEGEIKVRRVIEKDYNDYKGNMNDFTSIIYSGDADMILLLATLNNLTNIYQVVDKVTILSMGVLFDIHIQKYCKLSIPSKSTKSDKLAHNIPNIDMLYDDVEDRFIKFERSKRSIKNDFLFINLLMGNDYLPKLLYIKLENIWGAYQELVPFYRNGLVSYSRGEKEVNIDKEFLANLIISAAKKNKINYDSKFSIDEMTDTDYLLYNDYIRGLVWCFDMYQTGVCSDYRYIYDHSKCPHYTGFILNILSQHTHVVNQTKSIDSDLYGILLIPEKANSLLSDRQKELSSKLVLKHPIIYEEERCQKCTIFSKTMSGYNKQLKNFKEEEDSDTIDLKIDDLRKKIKTTNETYAKHKGYHETLTIGKITEIEKTFLLLNVK